MLRRSMMAGGSAPPPSGWNAAVAALPNLWGWWKLDEVAAFAVQATDASGNGRHGAYSAAGSQSAGLFAGSATAQATLGGHVALPVYTTAATPKFSVGAFIRTTTGTTEQQILSADSNSTNRIFQFRKNSLGGHQLEFVTISPSVTTTTATTAINDGNPHLAIVVFDQSLAAGDGRVKMYLDGALDGASTTAITISSSLTRALAIGSRRADLDQGLWSGAIDECFFCDDAISASAIAALWAARNS